MNLFFLTLMEINQFVLALMEMMNQFVLALMEINCFAELRL